MKLLAWTNIASVIKSVLTGACLALAVASAATAGPILTTTDDGYTANDPNRAPTAVGDRNEASAFFEVRHLTSSATPANPRKKVGFIKYNITGISPSVFASATLSGGFSTTGQDGPGVWNVYGLIDGTTNTDDVPDGSFNEANWTEGGLTYAKGLGVDPTVSTTDNSLGLDLSEIVLLGQITIPGDLPFASNPSTLPLGAFLAADTNGVVTFLITDANAAGTEWRVTARENTAAGNGTDAEGGVLLSFVPEPTSVCLALMGLCGALGIRRNRRSA
jgi:hypothetical protein